MIEVVKYIQKKKTYIYIYTYIHILYLPVQKINILRTSDHLSIWYYDVTQVEFVRQVIK